MGFSPHFWMKRAAFIIGLAAAACGRSAGDPGVVAGGPDASTDGGFADEAGLRGPLTSVLMHHAHPSRDGAYVEPQITRASAAHVHLDSSFRASFDGVVYAQALFVKRAAQAVRRPSSPSPRRTG